MELKGKNEELEKEAKVFGDASKECNESFVKLKKENENSNKKLKDLENDLKKCRKGHKNRGDIEKKLRSEIEKEKSKNDDLYWTTLDLLKKMKKLEKDLNQRDLTKGDLTKGDIDKVELSECAEKKKELEKKIKELEEWIKEFKKGYLLRELHNKEEITELQNREKTKINEMRQLQDVCAEKNKELENKIQDLKKWNESKVGELRQLQDVGQKNLELKEKIKKLEEDIAELQYREEIEFAELIRLGYDLDDLDDREEQKEFFQTPMDVYDEETIDKIKGLEELLDEMEKENSECGEKVKELRNNLDQCKSEKEKVEHENQKKQNDFKKQIEESISNCENEKRKLNNFIEELRKSKQDSDVISIMRLQQIRTLIQVVENLYQSEYNLQQTVQQMQQDKENFSLKANKQLRKWRIQNRKLQQEIARLVAQQSIQMIDVASSSTKKRQKYLFSMVANVCFTLFLILLPVMFSITSGNQQQQLTIGSAERLALAPLLNQTDSSIQQNTLVVNQTISGGQLVQAISDSSEHLLDVCGHTIDKVEYQITMHKLATNSITRADLEKEENVDVDVDMASQFLESSSNAIISVARTVMSKMGFLEAEAQQLNELSPQLQNQWQDLRPTFSERFGEWLFRDDHFVPPS